MDSLFDNPKFKDRWAMYETALAAELPIVDRDTCAIILAMLDVWGNHEAFTHNHRLVCEQLYAQRRFHIQGGEIPDLDFAILVKCYKTQLEIMQERERRVPDYIDRLFQKRYEFHFNKD